MSFFGTFKPGPIQVRASLERLEVALLKKQLYGWHLDDAVDIEDRAKEILDTDYRQNPQVRSLALFKLHRDASRLREKIANYLTINNEGPNHA